MVYFSSLFVALLCSRLANAFLDLDLNAIKDGLQTVEKLADAIEMAGKKCVYKCQAGYDMYVNYSHIPSSNGCGSLGVDVDLSHLSALNACCDEHDICYDTCFSVRKTCDKKFQSCLMESCDLVRGNKRRNNPPVITIDACKITAELVYQGATALGCKSYLDAQRKACTCVRHNSLHKDL